MRPTNGIKAWKVRCSNPECGNFGEANTFDADMWTDLRREVTFDPRPCRGCGVGTLTVTEVAEVTCPGCGSADLCEGTLTAHDDGAVTPIVECLECDATWGVCPVCGLFANPFGMPCPECTQD